ncbi:hypothetical protein Nepgr_024205 [Nepenthes gracilis]|uniref:ELMO domain-containing protein n=1 Tax=Nepenthes gracilis TaxID=150966 RepID=A0AAD3XYD7_NEPGR|nr:hypothetical protein Nepgr_024205 [Nepenthes gracilis]
MDNRDGSSVAVRKISQGLDRGTTCHSTSAEVVAGSAAWLGRGLSCVCAQRKESDVRPPFYPTPAQEECLHRLRSRIDVAYDSSNRDHQETLRALWNAAFPGKTLHGLISEQWKEMGWQGKDPSTDFRGGGFISLENLLFLARNFPKSFQDLLRKQEGDRAMWEYPFAVAGVNITFMLIRMLDLEAVKPRTLVGATFLKFLAENESAFDLLYCIAFKLLDRQWLEMHASYMDFNTVMKSTCRQLEREILLEDITRVEDLPSYSLLARSVVLGISPVLPTLASSSFSRRVSMALSRPFAPVLPPLLPRPKVKTSYCTTSGASRGCNSSYFLLNFQRNKIGRTTMMKPLVSIDCDESIHGNILTLDGTECAKGSLKWIAAFSFGAMSWLTPVQVAFSGNNMKVDAVYEIGEIFELGIQLSYLILLLSLLGIGTFFVIRQVLVRRELDLSAKELQEQVRSGDASATEYFELGAVMLRRKVYPAATKYLLQAIEKWDGDDQDLAQVYNALGVCYVRDEKLDKGIAQFEKAVKLQPGYVTAWNNLGDAYEKKKDLKSALKAFEEVILFDPNNTVARPRVDLLRERVKMYKGVPLKSKDR